MKMNLKNFDEFILESLIISLNESVINYSDKFVEILSLIDNPISKLLLDYQNRDEDVKTNWFDIGKDPESISFLIDAKAKKMETESATVRIRRPNILIGYEFEHILKELDFNRDKLYIPEISDVGKIIRRYQHPIERDLYYLLYFDETGDKQCVIHSHWTSPDDSEMWKKNRQEIRVGRGIRALLQSLDQKFTDQQLEDFVNKWKAAWEIAKDAFRNFEVVRGNKIAEYYHVSKYSNPNKGELGSSCMKEKPSWYFGIYTQNSAVCGLLILKDPKDTTKILARALVWNLTLPKITFMDRVYFTKPEQLQLFRAFAKSQGWYSKKSNDNKSSTELIRPDGEIEVFDILTVRIKGISYTGFPYVDTIKYYNASDSRYVFLTTYDGGGDSDFKLLEDTDGNWISDECEDCGGRGMMGCYGCDATGSITCPECEGKKETDCQDCDGTKTILCHACDGVGDIDDETCPSCEGQGTESCTSCRGTGRQVCQDCEGEEMVTCGYCLGEGQIPCENSNCEASRPIRRRQRNQ